MSLRSIGIKLLVGIGVFIGGVLAMNFVIMPILVRQGASIIVPDVRGQSEQQAHEMLRRLALNLQVERSQYDPEIPTGYVVSQRPRANDTVKQGRTVSVVLSLGARTQHVPDLKDMSLRQGRLTLTSQKLVAGRVARVYVSGDVRETVLACSPGPGAEVGEGSAVDLLVGVGGQPKRFLMPDLAGQDLLFIREKLEARGFRVSNVRYEKRKGAYPNTVIDQYPRPGVMIREGDSIELVAAGSQ